MLAIANIVLPIFALIFVGYLLRHLNILGSNACTELNRFVVYLALPALTIDIMVNSTWSELYQPGFLWAFELAVGIIFAFSLLIYRLRMKNLAEASIGATAASYANTGYIGIPLCALAFGHDNLGPAMIAAILTVSANFMVSIILLEVSLQTEKNILLTIRNVFYSLVKNPLIMAPVVAGLIIISGFHFPEGIMQSIKLLGGAASPCALVATGLFLAQPQQKAGTGISLELVFIKLIVQPLLAWYLAFHVFEMPPLWAKSAVLLSALPTGTGPFMLAELYRKGAGIASRSILISTTLSIITISIWLTLL